MDPKIKKNEGMDPKINKNEGTDPKLRKVKVWILK